MTNDTVHFWLRDESKEGEKRSALLPVHCKELLKKGFKITVEKSKTRCVEDEEYAKIPDITMVPSGSWVTDAPNDAIIIGLKELPDEVDSLKHKHVYFAHCYKNQDGWENTLGKFIKGGGMLYDLEFLQHDNGRRVAAFGRSAGYIGAATGLLAWCQQQESDSEMLSTLAYHKDYPAMAKTIHDRIKATGKPMPKALVIGALGRCGNGAVQSLLDCGVPDENILKWDLAETKKGGPFNELLDVDVFVNCIYLHPTMKIPPFITAEMVNHPRKLSVIVDVSCEAFHASNPIQVPGYDNITTMFDPVLRCAQKKGGNPPLDLVAIDHLPSLVPYESSMEFVNDLLPHLLDFENSPVWERAKSLYEEKCASIPKQN